MRPLLLVALSLLVASPAFAGDKHAKRFNEAKTIVEDLGSQITEDTWKQARCTTVLHIGKGGFLFGGTGGWGVVTCREEGGGWSPPAILKAGGPTFGAQIGGAKVQVLMVFVDLNDIDKVVHATPVLQNTAQATAGPKGVGVSGGGNPVLAGGVVSVSQSSGLYAGATWEGLVIEPDEKEIKALYGEGVGPADVLVKPSVSMPEAAKALTAAITKRAPKK